MLEKFLHLLESSVGDVVVLVLMTGLLLLNRWIFHRINSVKESIKFLKNSIGTFVVFVGLLAFILLLPIDKTLRGQILSFLGIIISAAIALSSTTLLGNLIAGIMNNSMNRFRNGDLIQVGDLVGRVTKKGFFHVEVQMEDSNFVTIPNLFMASNPVKLTRKTNTVISSTVSLGYDEHHSKVEECLKKAAKATGLTDPYVFITTLGDFSVTYKTHGFLEDSDKFFTTTSLLKANIMDALHEAKIEIVSPTFMNQRRVEKNTFIPRKERKKETKKPEKSPEELIFDRAIESEEVEKKKDLLKELEEKIKGKKEELEKLSGEEDIETTKRSIARLDKMRERMIENIEAQNEKIKERESK